MLNLFCIASLVPALMADPLQLRPAQVLQSGGAALGANLFTYAIPCATDWNGDGKKDLLVGYQSAGKIAVFLNSGTDAQPVFTNFFNLKYLNSANGLQDILHTSSGCGAPAPWVCDFDGDSKRDLLVGSGGDGTVWFYRNMNTDAAPILAPGVRLTVGGNPLTVSYRATPYLYDWNGDGLNDLLCGNGDGYLFFFKNMGAAQAPAYAAPARIQAGGKDLNLGIRSVVRMFDWDGNGVKDLIGSSNDGVYWCKNIGSDSSPSLQAPVALCAPGSGSGLAPIYTGQRMRLDLVDWNNDGAIDLLLGNANGTVYYYEGYRFAFTRAAPQPGGQLRLEWNSAPYLKYHLLANSCPTNLQHQVATNLPSEGTITSWTNSAQGDQQYYHVRIAD